MSAAICPISRAVAAVDSAEAPRCLNASVDAAVRRSGGDHGEAVVRDEAEQVGTMARMAAGESIPAGRGPGDGVMADTSKR